MEHLAMEGLGASIAARVGPRWWGTRRAGARLRLLGSEVRVHARRIARRVSRATSRRLNSWRDALVFGLDPLYLARHSIMGARTSM